MALAQHKSYDVRFQQQVDNAETYLIPFIESVQPVHSGLQVMEIGCGEGGVLKPFAARGARCLGVDLSAHRIQKAEERMQPEIEAGQAQFLAQDVYDPAFLVEHRGKYDLILLKDTIEHIPNQEKFIPYLKAFLKPTGTLFFGFPPWWMPFGGHQQICRSKWLGFLPYFHLLPPSLYRGILKAAGEPERVIQELMEIKQTGISLHRFERIVGESGLKVVQRRLYLFNPIYRYKFGLQPREQATWLGQSPYLRDFFTTAGWYLVQTQ